MYLLISPHSASNTAAISLRDRLVAAARLFRTSDLLGALGLLPFAAVGAFAILCHPPCEVSSGNWSDLYAIRRENQRIGRKLEALAAKLQPGIAEKRWKFRRLRRIHLGFSIFQRRQSTSLLLDRLKY